MRTRTRTTTTTEQREQLGHYVGEQLVSAAKATTHLMLAHPDRLEVATSYSAPANRVTI